MEGNETRSSELDFYADAIRILDRASIPFLVGGAYALREYTGVVRDTKDFDLFVRPGHVRNAFDAFRSAGYHGELAFPHWLGKIHHGENFIDIIFRAGNGLCEVDDLWFERSAKHRVMGEEVALVPAEEMIWQKAYIMERERFDGADIAHLIRSLAEKLDWAHLLRRFGSDWRVLASHLLMFGFIYPQERGRVPHWVMSGFLAEASKELDGDESTGPLCRGTLISRAQYLPDIERWGYRDVRLDRSKMSVSEIEIWTDAIDRR